MPDHVALLPLILLLVLGLELAKRFWHQTRDDRITVAHGAAVVALSLACGDTSPFGRLALGVTVAGWALSRLTIDQDFWRVRRLGRWDLWHLTGSPLSSWPVELAVLSSLWPLWTWTSIGQLPVPPWTRMSIGQLPVPPWPWEWAWGHAAVWVLAGIVAKLAWIWQRPDGWGGSLGLGWMEDSPAAEENP